jgi:hypothetical protein
VAVGVALAVCVGVAAGLKVGVALLLGEAVSVGVKVGVAVKGGVYTAIRPPPTACTWSLGSPFR